MGRPPSKRIRRLPDGIGQRLSAARSAVEWTQGELADAAGVNITKVSFYEMDRALPSVRTLRQLAIALDCSTDYLLGMDA